MVTYIRGIEPALARADIACDHDDELSYQHSFDRTQVTEAGTRASGVFGATSIGQHKTGGFGSEISDPTLSRPAKDRLQG